MLLMIKLSHLFMLTYNAFYHGILIESYQNHILFYKWNANFITWGKPDKNKLNFISLSFLIFFSPMGKHLDVKSGWIYPSLYKNLSIKSVFYISMSLFVCFLYLYTYVYVALSMYLSLESFLNSEP